MLFGVTDEGEICGIKDKPAIGRRRVNDFIRGLVEPSPSVRIDVVNIDGSTVVVLEVHPGQGILHALVMEKSKPEYYVRRDATTFYARPEEVAAISNSAAQFGRVTSVYAG